MMNPLDSHLFKSEDFPRAYYVMIQATAVPREI